MKIIVIYSTNVMLCQVLQPWAQKSFWVSLWSIWRLSTLFTFYTTRNSRKGGDLQKFGLNFPSLLSLCNSLKCVGMQRYYSQNYSVNAVAVAVGLSWLCLRSLLIQKVIETFIISLQFVQQCWWGVVWVLIAHPFLFWLHFGFSFDASCVWIIELHNSGVYHLKTRE